jgi:acetyl-CoA carboxylase biotin carboxyl carrier protein
MDLKQIEKLIKLVSDSGVSELKVKENELEVTIKNVITPQAPMMAHYPAMMPATGLSQAIHSQTTPAAPTAGGIQVEMTASEPKSDSTFIFRSPMIGTFYRKPGPDKPLFVNIGDTIKKGDVLCIIEAMKLFNEIEFDGEGGKIVKILVEESSPVEYDQPLFEIEKI